MYARIVPLFLLVASVACKDLIKGQDVGVKIFDEKKEASPTIWRQAHNFTISANDSDVISKVIVTDLREDKDGDARIVEGGPGNKNVTIEVKSPTVLRGYEYRIEVYAVSSEEVTPELTFDENNADISNVAPNKDMKNPEVDFEDLMTRINGTDNFNIPKNPNIAPPGVVSQDRTGRSSEISTEASVNAKDSTTKSSITSTSTTSMPGNVKSNQGPLVNGENMSSTTMADQSTPVPPTILGKDQKRFARDVKTVTQSTTEVSKGANNTNQDSTTAATTKTTDVNGPALKTNSATTSDVSSSPLPPIVLNNDMKINEQRFTRETEGEKNKTKLDSNAQDVPIETNYDKMENKTSELEADNLDHTVDNQASTGKTLAGNVTPKPLEGKVTEAPKNYSALDWQKDSKLGPINKDGSSTIKPVIPIERKFY